VRRSSPAATTCRPSSAGCGSLSTLNPGRQTRMAGPVRFGLGTGLGDPFIQSAALRQRLKYVRPYGFANGWPSLCESPWPFTIGDRTPSRELPPRQQQSLPHMYRESPCQHSSLNRAARTSSHSSRVPLELALADHQGVWGAAPPGHGTAPPFATQVGVSPAAAQPSTPRRAERNRKDPAAAIVERRTPL
jgi:hypothetical protein